MSEFLASAVTFLPMLAIDHGGHWHMWFFFPFFWILGIIVCFALVRVLVFRFAGPRYGWHGRRWRYDDDPNSAEEVLRTRFAKGEIDEAEYRRLRDVLKKD